MSIHSATGLTSEEARVRLSAVGPNALPSEAEKSLFQIALSVAKEPMLLLLISAGAISFLLAELVDALLLMGTVFIVLGISIYQERRTERALHALHELTAPLALVIRDEKEVRVPSSQLVPGDLILLLEGDRVAADAKLVTDSAIELDESQLTGESIPVPKRSGDGVFTGSLVVRGHGQAEVTQTGVHTALGKIGKSLQEITQERTLLQKNIDRIVRIVGVFALIAVLAVFYLYGSSRGDWLTGALAGIATAMALIPEEFPVIITLFMALGAWRMAKVRVIARRPASIEALGSVTVLCVDKTGTLTRNEMEVAEIQLDDSVHELGSAPLPEGFFDLIRTAALAAPIRPFDPMDRAFKKLAESVPDEEEYRSIKEFPLTRERLAYVHIWQGKEKFFAAAKGAPEQIAKMCQLSSVELERLNNQVHEAAKRGFRIIGVARANFEPDELENFEVDKDRFEFLGITLLHDPVREGVPEAVNICKSAGMRTIMITGDHPTTALAVGKEIGLNHQSGCITGTDLEKMNDSQLQAAVRNSNIFARVTPEHKLRLVRALKANGEVVAMTGDGVNDAPALRAAHVGIAMGARGTDVAREAASLVLTDDNYTSIVAGIRRGRAIFANIQKAMSYVIAVHVPIFGMALVPVFEETWPLILLPALVAFHEVIIDPACSVVFEVEEPDPEIMERSPRPPQKAMFGKSEILYALAQGLAVFVAVFLVFWNSLTSEASDTKTRSLTFGTLLLANVFLILANRSRKLTIIETLIKRRNSAVPWILTAALLLLVLLLNVPFLQSAFELSAISLLSYLQIFAIAYLSVSWTDAHKLLSRFKSSH